MVLLDTTLVIDLLRNRKDAYEVIKRLEERRLPKVISAPTVQEIIKGVHTAFSPDKESGKVEDFLEVVSVLPFDSNAARIAGRIEAELLKAGTPIDLSDIQIASIAISHEERVVTKNVKHFSLIKGANIESY